MLHTTSQQDTPPRLDPTRLQRFAAEVYQSIGVPEQDAQLAADTLVQADLWGHQSHGLLRLGWYVARLKSGVDSQFKSFWYLHVLHADRSRARLRDAVDEQRGA